MPNVFGVPEAVTRPASRSVSSSTAMTVVPETCPWIVAVPVPGTATVPLLSPVVPPPPPHAASNKAMTAMERNPLIILLLFIPSSLQNDFYRFRFLVASCFLLVPDLLLSGCRQKRYLLKFARIPLTTTFPRSIAKTLNVRAPRRTAPSWHCPRARERGSARRTSPHIRRSA